MNDPLFNKLREASWRRPLTADEEAELRAWLVAHPNAHLDIESDSALRDLLNRLPDAPVPSNFTSRVLAAVERDDAAVLREKRPRTWSWRAILPKVALAAIALFLSGIYYEQRQSTQSVELLHKAAAVSEFVALSDPAVLRDFETIRRIEEAPIADRDLLALGLK